MNNREMEPRLLTLLSPVHEEYGCTEVEALHFEYEWKIKNFTLLTQKNGDGIFSPIFSAKENGEPKWKLKLYPQGENEYSADNVSLFLHLDSQVNATKKIEVHCELSIFKSDSISCTNSFVETYETNHAYGFRKMIERSKLINSNNSDDSITVRCKVNMTQRIFTMPLDTVSFNVEKGRLSDDFSQFLEASQFRDVTIIVGSEKYTAHKLVLAARSSVFAAMFEHKELEENRKNEVKIEDLEPATVRGMLQFMYTDRVTDLEILARGLLKASDKYNLDFLRLMCEETLYKALTIDNAAEILVLSDLYHSAKLKKYVTAFINDHLFGVTQSDSYNIMVGTYPALLGGLVSLIAARRESSK